MLDDVGPRVCSEEQLYYYKAKRASESPRVKHADNQREYASLRNRKFKQTTGTESFQQLDRDRKCPTMRKKYHLKNPTNTSIEALTVEIPALAGESQIEFYPNLICAQFRVESVLL